MTTTILSASMMIQSGGGGRATTPPATTQNPSPATKQDIDAAARQFSEAIRSNVQQGLNAARYQMAQEKGGAAAAPVLAPAPPTPPDGPRTSTIRGRDGTQTITLPPHVFENTIPQQAVDISIAFFMTLAIVIIGLPLARAFARRMDRRGGTAQVSNEGSAQLAHLNHAVDAIALEVERISQGKC